MVTRQNGTVIASIWAEDYAIAMVLFKKVGEIHTPLESWRSNLSAFDFGFVEVLEKWQADHGLTKAVMNEPPDYKGKAARHPIKSISPVRTDLKPEIELFEGLASLYYAIQQETIDFTHYNKARFMEQIKRLDTNRDPAVMAFLQGIVKPASGGYGKSKSKDLTPA